MSASSLPVVLILDELGLFDLESARSALGSGRAIHYVQSAPAAQALVSKQSPQVVLLTSATANDSTRAICAMLHRAAAPPPPVVLVTTERANAVESRQLDGVVALVFASTSRFATLLQLRGVVDLSIRAGLLEEENRRLAVAAGVRFGPGSAARRPVRSSRPTAVGNAQTAPVIPADSVRLAPRESQGQIEFEALLRASSAGCVLLIRVENYYALKDALGYDSARQVLGQAIERLRSTVRSTDVVLAALGAPPVIVALDAAEAIAIFDQALNSREVVSIQQRVEQALNEPVMLQQKLVPLRAAVGRAVWPADGCCAGDLLQEAALSIRANAQSQAQRTGDLEQAREAAGLEADLYDALSKDELELHFQPKYRLNGATEIVGVEALLRWHRNQEEWVPPDRFIPIAESNGLILNFGKWAIEEAVRCQLRWQQAGLGIVPVAVNVSAEQFLQPDFLEHLLTTCLAADLQPTALEVEITENCLIDQPERVIAVLERLKASGFGVALDDFGTGFSSLSYLRTLPIDTLKIDRSFIGALDGEDFDPALTAGIVGIGLALGLRIVAEGIETQPQWDMLSEWGCHQGQGYLMSRPLTCQTLMDLLSSGS